MTIVLCNFGHIELNGWGLCYATTMINGVVSYIIHVNFFKQNLAITYILLWSVFRFIYGHQNPCNLKNQIEIYKSNYSNPSFYAFFHYAVFYYTIFCPCPKKFGQGQRQKLNRNFFDIFQNIFCLYYDLYNANFDSRGFWAATTTA